MVACLPALPADAQRMTRAEEPQKTGLTWVGDTPFPNPEAWPDLPVTVEAARGAYVVPVREGRPYLISARMKTSAALAGSATSETAEIFYGKSTVLAVPDTGGEWKQVGLFFRSAPGATGAMIQLGPRGRGPIEVAELRVREAGESEYAAAYADWRSQFPPRDLTARPGDGQNLGTFLNKLMDPVAPKEPLRVIGIGSSYTNMLGNGERLIQWIREYFPKAPPILYEKHVGSAVEYDFTRGWMRQHVLGRRPDLVILYSGGKAADLDRLLADFRAHSTADVIVASLHLREQDREITDATVNAPEWDAVREVALKYGCEWVDNRREWAAYLREHEKPIEWLLKDAVHQNDHGALVINENICRHLAPGRVVASDTERILKPGYSAGGESVAGSPVPGGKITVTFRGNRLDLIGRRSATGGHLSPAQITLDGRPLDEVTAFVTTVIVPGPENFKPERGSPADRSPHQIRLGDPARIVPQRWSIRMHGDAGAYELIGSITGHDGYGHNGDDFTGRSGQITVPSELWRRRLEADGETYTNRDGDTFTWEVRRAVTGGISFRGESDEIFTETIVDQLENGSHTLEIGPLPEGGITLEGFRVHEPPFRP